MSPEEADLGPGYRTAPETPPGCRSAPQFARDRAAQRAPVRRRPPAGRGPHPRGARWASEVGVARLERIRAIQRELGGAIAPYSGRLWELKGQQLLAFRDGRDADPATEALRHLAGQMTAHLQTFLSEHNTGFTDIDMPVDAALRLISVAVERFIDTKFATEVSFEVPDDVLQGFPEPVRTFFHPASAERPPPQT